MNWFKAIFHKHDWQSGVVPVTHAIPDPRCGGCDQPPHIYGIEVRICRSCLRIEGWDIPGGEVDYWDLWSPMLFQRGGAWQCPPLDANTLLVSDTKIGHSYLPQGKSAQTPLGGATLSYV